MSGSGDIFAGSEGKHTKLRLDIDRSKMAQIQKDLEGISNGIERVIQRATTRTVTAVRVRIVRAVNKTIVVQGEKIYEKGNRRRPVIDWLERSGNGKYITGGGVSVGGRRLALGRFHPEQHWKMGSQGAPVRDFVSYQILRGGGRANISDAFMATMKSGYTGIFRRVGKERFPLEQLYGPSIPHVAEQHSDVQQVLNQDAMGIFYKNIDDGVAFLVSRKRVTNG